MKGTVTEELKSFAKKNMGSGRCLDKSDALRLLNLRDDYDLPALDAALLEGLRSPHETYGNATFDRIRKSARRAK